MNTQTKSLNKVKNVIAISSCKGGVGKSTIAAHFACELHLRGLKVGLLDCDIYGPSIPHLFNIYQPSVTTDTQKMIVPIEKNDIKIMSFGFLLNDKPAIMRGPIVTRYIQQILLNTAWGELDYLIIDLPPGTGDVHLTITQTIRLSGAVIITTPHQLSLIDVARGIIMFEKVNVPLIGIIENMAYFQPESSEKKHYLFGQQNESILQEKFGLSILAEIPVLSTLTLPFENAQRNLYIQQATDKLLSFYEHQIATTEFQIPKVVFDAQNITLTWSDGREQRVSNIELRFNSLDALSVNELTGERLLKRENIRKDIQARKITPLGNYALGVEWNDGHSAGIYPYTLITKLSQESVEKNNTVV